MAAVKATPIRRMPIVGRPLIERDKICTDAPSRISTVEEANYVPFSSPERDLSIPTARTAIYANTSCLSRVGCCIVGWARRWGWLVP